MNLKVIELNDKKYMVVDELLYNKNDYLYLSNIQDPEDIMIRKVDKNDKDYLLPLDSDNEFDEVIKLFADKFNK